jgi:hypothetical protein
MLPRSCALQGNGSPYRFKDLITIKSEIAAMPDLIKNLSLVIGGYENQTPMA